jgi:hypothetical protein
MRGDPPISLEELLTYYDGVFYATVALKGRIAKLGPESRPAVREIGRYQTMVKAYGDALQATASMHAERS